MEKARQEKAQSNLQNAKTEQEIKDAAKAYLKL